MKGGAQAKLEFGDRDELNLFTQGVSTMGTVTEREQRDEANKIGAMVLRRASIAWEESLDLMAGAADRLLTHMASEHGIPVSIAQRIPTPALAKLCRDDQAQDLEDWQR